MCRKNKCTTNYFIYTRIEDKLSIVHVLLEFELTYFVKTFNAWVVY